MACGTPVVTVPDEALVEVAGGAAVVVEEGGLAGGIRQSLADRDRLIAAGLERVRPFSWPAAAEQTVGVYHEAISTVSVSAVVVSHRHAAELERSLPSLLQQVDELVVVANLPG